MVKVKMTRYCFIKGKQYSVGDIAEVIENDARYLMAIEKAVTYVGNPEPKMVKKGRKQMDLVADIRTMLNDFGVSATLTDVSAGTSTTVKGIFSNESEEVDVGDVQVEITEPHFNCVYDDVSHAVENDTIVISGTTYKIAGAIKKDVSGYEAILILKNS